MEDKKAQIPINENSNNSFLDDLSSKFENLNWQKMYKNFQKEDFLNLVNTTIHINKNMLYDNICISGEWIVQQFSITNNQFTDIEMF